MLFWKDCLAISILDALHCRNKKRPPVWLMRQAGRYSPKYQRLRAKNTLYELFHNPSMIEEITLQPIEELGVDAAIIFSDILLVLDTFGITYRYPEGGPVVDYFKGPLKIKDDSFLFLREAIGNLKKRLSVPLLGFAGAPYTISTYMGGHQEFIEPLTEGVIRLLRCQVESGVDAVQLFDSWAGNLDDIRFKKLVLEPLRIIKKSVDVPLIFFCKNLGERLGAVLETGVDAVSLDCPLLDVRQKYGPSVCLQGNLDPDLLFTDEDTVTRAVKDLLNSLKGDQGFIFNLAHGIKPGSSFSLVKHLVRIAQEEGARLWS